MQRSLKVQLKKLLTSIFQELYTVIKKANFEDHMKKSETHRIYSFICFCCRMLFLKETNSVPVGPSNQTTILPQIYSNKTSSVNPEIPACTLYSNKRKVF